MKGIKSLLALVGLTFALLAGAVEAGKININTATAEEFASLNGIGKAKAEAIIQHREKVGKFNSVEELTLVKGIGTAILDKNKERLALE
ncbi:MAG: ComEA family DNA-binding protein [Venatoribacter sp.]